MVDCAIKLQANNRIKQSVRFRAKAVKTGDFAKRDNAPCQPAVSSDPRQTQDIRSTHLVSEHGHKPSSWSKYSHLTKQGGRKERRGSPGLGAGQATQAPSAILQGQELSREANRDTADDSSCTSANPTRHRMTCTSLSKPGHPEAGIAPVYAHKRGR